MKQNGLKAWILAARPKTLTGAMAPVIVGGALAYRMWGYEPERLLPFVLCLLFAVFMQIDANLVNDYFDWKKGSDRDDRLGPERACAQGWITPEAMKRGIAAMTVLSCLVGLPLIKYGGWWLIGIGALCVVFCFLYTTRFSYLGLGDLLVIVFFGIVPVGFTYYVLTGEWTWQLMLIAFAQGLVTDTLLIVNNYRDIDQDRASGKKTVIVRFGRNFGLYSYLACGEIGTGIVGFTLLGCYFCRLWTFFIIIYLALHTATFIKMTMCTGRQLNQILGSTARNIFIFSLTTALALFTCRFFG